MIRVPNFQQEKKHELLYIPEPGHVFFYTFPDRLPPEELYGPYMCTTTHGTYIRDLLSQDMFAVLLEQGGIRRFGAGEELMQDYVFTKYTGPLEAL